MVKPHLSLLPFVLLVQYADAIIIQQNKFK